MKIDLSQNEKREMYFFDKKRCEIYPISIVSESRSGDTIEMMGGQRMRTSTKTHAIFNRWDFARLAQKQQRNEIDDEYDEILKRNGLRRIKST